jgi:hypothetical protein
MRLAVAVIGGAVAHYGDAPAAGITLGLAGMALPSSAVTRKR